MTRRSSWRHASLMGLGATLAISLLALATEIGLPLLLIAPFGASAVLAFALPESPLAQPRAILGGHLLAAAIGLALVHLPGAVGWAPPLALTCSVAVGLAIFAMLATGTLHAPAGATPLLITQAVPTLPWSFLWTTVLFGALGLVLVAIVWHRLVTRTPYPKYWL